MRGNQNKRQVKRLSHFKFSKKSFLGWMNIGDKSIDQRIKFWSNQHMLTRIYMIGEHISLFLV